MAEKPAWLSYLELSKANPIIKEKPRTYQLGITAPLTQFEERLAANPDLATAQKQYETAKLQAQALGVAEPDAPKKGFVSKALDVITFLPSVATSAVKEFVVDPLYQVAYALQDPYLTPAQRAAAQDREKVSLDEFRKNVKERNFAQEMYSFLEYDKDAAIWEKALKEIGGLGIDIASTGGFGTGVRVASALGRKVAGSQLDNAAQDVFLKYGIKLPKETDAEFALRAADFGAEAALAQVNARSRGIINLFKNRFGDELGEEAFKALPKELQGGMQLYYRGKNFASLNAGGRATDAIAKRFGLEGLTNTTEKAVNAFQKTKNLLRTDKIESAPVKFFTQRINAVLNNVGGERSKLWNSFLKAAVSDADERDIITAFKGYRAADDITNFRNLLTSIAKPTIALQNDLIKFKKIDPEQYKKFEEFVDDPSKMLLADANDISISNALDFAGKVRIDYDRYYTEFQKEGFDINYLNDYAPFFFVKKEGQESMLTYLKAGLQNLPVSEYNPRKLRTRFLKDKIDPITKKVEYAADGVTPIRVPMTNGEMKAQLIKEGRKDLADMLETDPLNILAMYSSRASKIIAVKKILNKFRTRGVLFKSTAMQLNPDTELFIQATKNMPPNELTKTLDDFLAEPGKMSEWLEKVNDDLAKAYSTNDPKLIQEIKDEVGTFIDSLSDIKGGITTYIKGLRKNKTKLEEELEELQRQAPKLYPDQQLLYEVADKKAQLASIEDEILSRSATKESIKKEQKRISDQVKGKLPDGGDSRSKVYGDVLGEREGIEYIPVGKSEYAQEVPFYLSEDLAGLSGEKELVGLLDRYITVRGGNKKNNIDMVESLDQYLQFFRTGATFGRLAGFVLRNGYGAVQNNFIFANSTAYDHKIAKEIAQTRVLIDVGLTPFQTLTVKDKATKRVDNLINRGKLTESQAKRLRNDIDKHEYVLESTLENIRNELLERNLKSKVINKTTTYWDVYKTAVAGGVYDRYVVLPASRIVSSDDDVVAELLAESDTSRFVVRTDLKGKERGRVQRTQEYLLNFGYTISADVAGRKINLRPVQLTRDLNQLMEEFVRIAPIVTGLRKYGNTTGGANSAILLMKAAQFDYSDLSDFERRYLRRALPFYTYMKNNVSGQARILFNDPERVRRNLAGWDAVKDVMSDENGENYVIPDYISEMWGFLIDEDIRKKFVDSKYTPWWLDEIAKNPLAFRPESPALDIERYSKGGLGGFKDELISSSNPIAKAIIQSLVTESNLFSGRDYTNEDPAPNWYVQLDRIIPGNILGVNTNEKGEKVAPGKWIDAIKTIIPQIGTIERSALPVIDATLEAITGQPVDLAGQMDERAISNLLSQLGGVNVVTITPDTEKSVYYNMKNNINDTVNSIALDNGIDRIKLRETVNKLRDQGYSTENIVIEIDRLRQQGALNSVATTPIVGE
jgi:polyhydroxyalkanoate synthesis regulator phasin